MIDKKKLNKLLRLYVHYIKKKKDSTFIPETHKLLSTSESLLSNITWKMIYENILTSTRNHIH